MIEKGIIGNPYFVSIEIHGTQDVDLAGNDFYANCRDFITIQWNTHLVDLQRYWTGRDAKRVLARTGRMLGQNFIGDNLLVSIADYGEGLTGIICHNELLRSCMRSSNCRIDGDNGSLFFDIWGNELILCCQSLGNQKLKLDLSQARLPSSFAGPMADLLLSLENGIEPKISIQRNMATIRHVMAEDRSARESEQWELISWGTDTIAFEFLRRSPVHRQILHLSRCESQPNPVNQLPRLTLRPAGD